MRKYLRDKQSTAWSVVNNVVEQVMLKKQPNDVNGATLDAHESKWFDNCAWNCRLSKQLLIANSLMEPLVSFVTWTTETIMKRKEAWGTASVTKGLSNTVETYNEADDSLTSRSHSRTDKLPYRKSLKRLPSPPLRKKDVQKPTGHWSLSKSSNGRARLSVRVGVRRAISINA